MRAASIPSDDLIQRHEQLVAVDGIGECCEVTPGRQGQLDLRLPDDMTGVGREVDLQRRRVELRRRRRAADGRDPRECIQGLLHAHSTWRAARGLLRTRACYNAASATPSLVERRTIDQLGWHALTSVSVAPRADIATCEQGTRVPSRALTSGGRRTILGETKAVESADNRSPLLPMTPTRCRSTAP